MICRDASIDRVYILGFSPVGRIYSACAHRGLSFLFSTFVKLSRLVASIDAEPGALHREYHQHRSIRWSPYYRSKSIVSKDSTFLFSQCSCIVRASPWTDNLLVPSYVAALSLIILSGQFLSKWLHGKEHSPHGFADTRDAQAPPGGIIQRLKQLISQHGRDSSIFSLKLIRLFACLLLLYLSVLSTFFVGPLDGTLGSDTISQFLKQGIVVVYVSIFVMCR